MLPTTFQSHFIQSGGHYWMRGHNLGNQLGFSRAADGINLIYNRNKEELAPFTIKMMVEGETSPARYYDEQGCYIIAMLAKTPQAKIFRKNLAQFLSVLRQEAVNLATMQAEYDDLRLKVAQERWKRYLQCSEFSNSKAERLVALKSSGLLSMLELSKVFGLSVSQIYKVMNMYRQAQGDFKNMQPQWLQAARQPCLSA